MVAEEAERERGPRQNPPARVAQTWQATHRGMGMSKRGGEGSRKAWPQTGKAAWLIWRRMEHSLIFHLHTVQCPSDSIGSAMRVMPHAIQIEVEMPGDLAKFRLPKGVQKRLHTLLDKQDQGLVLTTAERSEAEGLVELSESLSLLRLRAQRSGRRAA
jgi:hypothetical protein